MIIVATLTLTAFAPKIEALNYYERPNWMVGVGYGQGTGEFVTPSGRTDRYYKGAVPLIRIGRMVGDRWMASLNYQSWVIEFGNRPVKTRRSLQHFGLGMSFFPGNLSGPSSGIYLRTGVGMGWTGTALVEISDLEEQGHGERLEEWGLGVFGEGGYEFFILPHFTAGLGVTFNYFDIGRDLVDHGWFTSGSVNLNLYY
jgi:hypothetical protein